MSDEQKTLDEVALEYGMKLVERMADQREALRDRVKTLETQNHVLGILLTNAVAVAGGKVVVPQQIAGQLSLSIVPGEGETAVLTVEEGEDAQTAAE